ncbi:MAG TPA: transporter substrate-binding domain-containing protein [Thiotrichaceae bacterium]|jgi:membrane-bound lytic murein transglycosylase F|nr:transporter substrate-binding domain-containing protein [Thiotrichaceae bacterium]HIM07582.1 transporter substrate-binding domain-containing protein [Gammaproteobacteria bacterium]
MKNIHLILKFMLLALIAPVSVQAKGKSKDVDYCQAPEVVSELTDVSTVASSLENLHDLKAINQRGSLRVLLHRKANTCTISQTERQLIQEFAHINDLDLYWVYVDNDWELLPELIKGRGDIILAQDQSLSASIKGQINFTHSWTNAAYKIVGRADHTRLRDVDDLTGRQVAAYKSSPVWNDLLALKNSQAGFALQEIPARLSYQDVMQRVKTGEYDLAVADSLFLDAYLPTDSDLQANFSLSNKRNMAWAVRADAGDLHKTLNQYLNQQYLTHDVVSKYFEDFSSIKDRGVLRIITSANPSHYYLHKGKLRGFEYELLSEFASKHRLRLDVVLANSPEEMFTLLKEGKGDVIAASLPGSLINIDQSIQYTSPYHYASPVIVGRDSSNSIIDIRDLSGRRITLANDSPYWDYMQQLQQQGLGFQLVKADAGVNTEGILLMVALGMYDLSVVGNHQINSAYTKDVGLKSQFVLSEPLPHRWVVRSNDKQLNKALNTFIEKEYRGTNYNVMHARYFEQEQINENRESLTRISSLSPYDDVTQHYADKYGFDWRLITALMFQESQFDPKASSYAGAKGLMQLIPATAKLMGIKDSNNAESSIYAGVRYLNYLRGKFEDALLLQDRMWFTLASYNAGYGRVKRARALAEEQGLDKNKWFDNVELAMLDLAKPYYKNGAKVRYCRCGQTVVYVREIRTRYFNYIRLLETQSIAGLTVSNRKWKVLN